MTPHCMGSNSANSVIKPPFVQYGKRDAFACCPHSASDASRMALWPLTMFGQNEDRSGAPGYKHDMATMAIRPSIIFSAAPADLLACSKTCCHCTQALPPKAQGFHLDSRLPYHSARYSRGLPPE